MRLPILFLAAGVIGASQQGSFEGTVTANTAFIPGNSSKVTYTAKWPHERFDIVSSQYGTVNVLYDFSKGTRSVLIPKKKQYWTVNIAERAQQIAAAVDQSGYQPGPTAIIVTPTTRTDQIVGRTCKYFTLGAAQDVDVCVANNMGQYIPDAQINAAQALGVPPAALVDSSYDNLGSRFPGGFFPLKIVSRASGPERVTWLVTSIDRHTVPDNTFAIPSGYTKIDPPSVSAN